MKSHHDIFDKRSGVKPVVGDWYVTCEHPSPEGLDWFYLKEGVLNVKAVSPETKTTVDIPVRWMCLCLACALTPLDAPRLATVLCRLEEPLRERLPN